MEFIAVLILVAVVSIGFQLARYRNEDDKRRCAEAEAAERREEYKAAREARAQREWEEWCENNPWPLDGPPPPELENDLREQRWQEFLKTAKYQAERPWTQEEREKFEARHAHNEWQFHLDLARRAHT